MSEEEMPQPSVTGIPIVTDRSGQPLIGCDAAVAILRSIAAVVEHLDEGDDPADLAAVIQMEADALECRAIAHTLETT